MLYLLYIFQQSSTINSAAQSDGQPEEDVSAGRYGPFEKIVLSDAKNDIHFIDVDKLNPEMEGREVSINIMPIVGQKLFARLKINCFECAKFEVIQAAGKNFFGLG